MTINQAIYQTLDGTGISTDDFPVSKRYVYGELKVARTELIKQELNKSVLFDSASLQTLEEVKFERTEIVPGGDQVLMSTDPVPEAIEYGNGVAVFVYLMNGRRLDPIDHGSIYNWCRKRFRLSDSVGYYFRNKHIIVQGYDDVDELSGFIEGHFQDPEEVTAMNNAGKCNNGDSCMPVYDYDFECPGLIERRVIEIAKAAVMRKLQIPTDSSNNTQFDPNVKSSPQSAYK